MYKKILVALDGSEHSNRAFNEAINLSKMADSKMTIMHIYLTKSSAFLLPNQAAYEKLKSQGEKILAEAKKKAESKGVLVETLLVEGDIVNQIVTTAKEGKYDLIVVGARGLTELQAKMLGSISEGVIKRAPCPVIVTR